MPFVNGLKDNEDLDSAFHNPFAAHSEGSFTSAIRTSETRPAFRRRGSDGPAKRTRNNHDPWHTEHSRSRTLDSGREGSTSQHPLAPAVGNQLSSDFAGTHVSAHETRPHMKRLLSDLDALPNSSELHGEGTNGQDPRDGLSSLKEDRKAYIVHEIKPKDSLPGVALRYGITTTDLRRTNQLWPSDPIHLRKVLYIPLEKACHSKQFRTTFHLDKGNETGLTEVDRARTEKERDGAGISEKHALNSLTIIRIPSSQLSFFPPASSTSGSAESRSKSGAHTLPRAMNAIPNRAALPVSFTSSRSSPRPRRSPPTAPSSYSASISTPQVPSLRSPGKTLGAILNALPIRIVPSSKHTFIGRLSSDSTSASASTPSDEQEWGHEMENVSVTSSSGTTNRGEDLHARYNSHLRNRSPPVMQLKKAGTNEAVEMEPYPSAFMAHVRPRHVDDLVVQPATVPNAVASYRADLAYINPESASSSSQPQLVVRTAQLQPSPIMQLPLTARRSKSRDS